MGHLEPSYVIQRFLDVQRVAALTQYLERLHAKASALIEVDGWLWVCEWGLECVTQHLERLHAKARPLRNHARCWLLAAVLPLLLPPPPLPLLFPLNLLLLSRPCSSARHAAGRGQQRTRLAAAQPLTLLLSLPATSYQQGAASSDHTTLLLNCYTKLKDSAKLDAFIQVHSSLLSESFVGAVRCGFKPATAGRVGQEQPGGPRWIAAPGPPAGARIPSCTAPASAGRRRHDARLAAL